MKLSALFKNKKLTKISKKNSTVKIDKKQLEKLTGGLDTFDGKKEPILGKAENIML